MKKLIYLLAAAATMMVAFASCDNDWEDDSPSAKAFKGQWVQEQSIYYLNGERVAEINAAGLAYINAIASVTIDDKQVHMGPMTYDYTIKLNDLVFTNLSSDMVSRTMGLSGPYLVEYIKYDSSREVVVSEGVSITFDEVDLMYVKVSPFEVDGKTFEYASGDLFYYDAKLCPIPDGHDFGFLNSLSFYDSKINIGGFADAEYTVSDGLMGMKAFSTDTNDLYAYYDATAKELVVFLRTLTDVDYNVDGTKYTVNQYRLVYKEHQDREFAVEDVKGTWISTKATYKKDHIYQTELGMVSLFQKKCIDGFTITDNTLTRVGDSPVSFVHKGTALYLSDSNFKTWVLTLGKDGNIVETITRDDYTFKPFGTEITFNEIVTDYSRTTPVAQLLNTTYVSDQTEYFYNTTSVGVKKYNQELVINSSKVVIDKVWELDYTDRGPFIESKFLDSYYYFFSIDGGESVYVYFVSDGDATITIDGKKITYNVAFTKANRPT